MSEGIKGERHSADVIGNAVHVMKAAIAEIQEHATDGDEHVRQRREEG
jgi:hypothetical protein